MDIPGPILVAGGTGLVGQALVHRLQAEGIPVRLLSRQSLSSQGGVETFSWEHLGAALEGVHGVVNLSGAGIGDARWTPARKALLRSSRVESTRRLVEAMAALPHRPRVWVNASAVGYYGPRDREPVDEGTSMGQGFLAELCQTWEAEALRAEVAGVRTILLRTGVVLAREGGALPVMARPVRLGLGAIPGRGDQGFSWIHLEDLVELICFALHHEALRGPLNATAPEPLPLASFMRNLAATLHRPIWPIPGVVSAILLRLLKGEAGRALVLEGAYVRPERALAAGFQFRFPHAAAALESLF